MQSWRCMRLCVKADLEDNMHACLPACQQQYVGPFSPLTAVHAEKTTSPQLLAGRALPTLSLATINPYTQSVACCQLTVNLGQQQQHHHHHQQQQQQEEEELTKKEQLMTNDNNNNNNKGILSGSNVLIDANDIGYFQHL
ncbi:hypothetical protein T07_4069 [Trichinella nelsoni]|uniref:Uncharacterized protein n=1 Tax=Trichinella nelsoni TaxID=6336 RepID=A0A0V0SJA9_9BILA|nr:hypothetical protein T07_4069 [Trichinella nelsoni]